MTLQWTLVATFLYIEIVSRECVYLFLLTNLVYNPEISWLTYSWQKLFKSRLAKALESYANVYSWAFAGILLLFFLDGIREVRKYSSVEGTPEAVLHAGANAEATIHMRLFRAQRNLIIKRLVSLISKEAMLAASASAAMAQAKNASETASKLMDGAGGDGDSKAVTALKNTIEMLKEDLKKAETDKMAMKKQAEGLQKEFDRVSDELVKLENQNNDGKKDN